MSENDQQPSFYEAHHALLFACIANAIVEGVGHQRGEAVIRKAIRHYGEERGGRMALRAQGNGHARSMPNYFGYGEYRITPGAMAFKIIRESPHTKLCVAKCPWYDAWNEAGLLSVGRLYCLEVDQALVRGFNAELQLQVNATLSGGAAQCEFIYHDADPTILNMLLLQYRRAVNPGAKAVMPWDYHVCHLFDTLERVAVGELAGFGQKAVDDGLTAFTNRYGEQAMQKVIAGRGRDYHSVPRL